MSRRPFTPSDEQRRIVKAIAGYGVPHEDIARVVRCSPPTLRKRFRQELDTATIEANARVAQCLYQQATTPGNIAATIFWLKARAGWREKQQVEVTGRDGQALEPPVVVIRRMIVDPAEGAAAGGPPLIEGERA
ncbi:MAG TPA: hypothetical protein VE684_05470 [Crenalkalicoccus sp.]|nr:hypothetical protein [Crenalkalicoccus sp.]